MKQGHHAVLSDNATREVAGLIGALLFGGASAIELIRLFTLKSPRVGYASATDWVLGGVAIALWVASSFVLARRSRKHRLLPVLGTFALFAQGILETVARSHFGIVLVLFAIVMPFLERLAFGGKLTLGERAPEPIRPDSGQEIL